MENLIGNLVLSTHGRDKNNIYLVLQNENNYVLLVDGNLRKMANPKKKNIRHIKNLNYTNETIKAKFATNSKVFDSEIYSCIKKFKNQIDIFKIIWYNYLVRRNFNAKKWCYRAWWRSCWYFKR